MCRQTNSGSSVYIPAIEILKPYCDHVIILIVGIGSNLHLVLYESLSSFVEGGVENCLPIMKWFTTSSANTVYIYMYRFAIFNQSEDYYLAKILKNS